MGPGSGAERGGVLGEAWECGGSGGAAAGAGARSPGPQGRGQELGKGQEKVARSHLAEAFKSMPLSTVARREACRKAALAVRRRQRSGGREALRLLHQGAALGQDQQVEKVWEDVKSRPGQS